MKTTLFAALATCLVITTGAVAADESDENAGPKAITVDAVAQTRFGVTIAVLRKLHAPLRVGT